MTFYAGHLLDAKTFERSRRELSDVTRAELEALVEQSVSELGSGVNLGGLRRASAEADRADQLRESRFGA